MNIDADTDLFCVLGDPVGHSLGPLMHNAAFAHTGYNGVYVAFRVTAIAAAVAGMRALGIRGASITLPHKVAALAHVDEADEGARKIGAVNTLLNRGGRVCARNTDSQGAVRALAARTPLAGSRIAVIGAGGAARAVAFGLAAEGGRVVIVNRGRDRGEALAGELGVDFIPLGDLGRLQARILVNTTPVGMAPARGATPVPEGCLQSGMVVMDAVYNPVRTRLLIEAERRGCATVDGVEMFVHQGALQFEWWTGLRAPLDVMRRAVADALGRRGAALPRKGTSG